MKKALFLGSFAVFGALVMGTPGQALAYGEGVTPVVPVTSFFGGGRSGSSVPVPQTTTSSGGQVLGASAYNFTVNLKYGMKGQDVTELQKILIADGYLAIPAPTGWFGPLTKAAVKQYQTAHGVEATGFVGPLTRAVLNQGTTTAPAKTSMIQKVVNTVASALAWSAST